MAQKVYDPDQISIIVGTHSVRGFGPDAFVKITANANLFEDEVGADGDDVTRTKQNDRRATLELTLMSTSDSNDILSAIANADKEAPNGAGIFPFMVRDRGTGRALYQAPDCWVQKEPDVDYARSAGVRLWTIRIARLERFDGGN